MMKKELNYIFSLSILGNVALILVRILYTRDDYFVFLLWNLFLATVPLIISQAIKYFRIPVGKSLISLLILWLLFIPNSPYIITDFVHLYDRPPVPLWYDLVLLLTSSLNGLILGFISIGHIESIVQKYRPGINLTLFRAFIVLAMSYGVYIGRYLRFNSWDAIINPVQLSKGMYHSVDSNTFGFILVFSFLNFILYSFFRSILPYLNQEAF
jgi:uncharacterized membrane protein